jgi:Flp pilus assembly protein TadG
MVEFSLVSISLFFVIFGIIELSRIVTAQNAVAEAARQGTRQAVPNAASSDSPWASPDNGQACSGAVFTRNVTGTGCLTDARILQVVKSTLGPFGRNVTLYANTSASVCNTYMPDATKLPYGQALVCISPGERGTAGTYSSCSAARTALGREPQAGELGTRYDEWNSPQYSGCYLVQVTVAFKYNFLLPLLGSAVSPPILASTTTMLAEY